MIMMACVIVKTEITEPPSWYELTSSAALGVCLALGGHIVLDGVVT